ncbi:type II toxin-antitoxin system RelE/ParE family toxin [Candidatus Woesearchaeota archaeon]|nr:type II toxin-antitoxin system RelE/ParE family toxin [Candidatus Woesearchaeota archaeon]
MAELEFHPAIEKDLKELQINQIVFQQIHETLQQAAKDPDVYSTHIRGLPKSFIKIKFRELRVVIWRSKTTTYVLKIFHRRQGYAKESLEKIMNLVRDYTG